MSFIGDFIGDVVGGITGTKQAAKAAEKAGETQAQAAERAIEEQRRQFERTLEILQPFVSAGTEALPGVSPYRELGVEQIGAIREFAAVGPEALRQQRALAGLAGPEAQRAAVGRQWRTDWPARSGPWGHAGGIIAPAPDPNGGSVPRCWADVP